MCNSSRLRNFVFRRKFSIYNTLPHAVRSGNVSPPFLAWYISNFRGLSQYFFPPRYTLCSSWPALKIAYLVFASEHVFYPTRTDDKCRCQSPHCYSSCAVRKKHIAAATPLSVYTLYRTYLNSYTHIISANVHICWKFPLQNVFSHSMPHTVAYSAHPNGKIKISSRNLRR